jgi:hypothetical protein
VPASPELHLQIVALLRYVDSCSSAPNPHADCPIASTVTPPPAQCLPECRDVFRTLLQRGRSPIKSASQDFDAGQLRLSEPKGSPSIGWHTSSLIQEVVRVVGSLPYRRSGGLILRRLVHGTSALGALACRGVDPEALVRHGMADQIKIGISSQLERASTVAPESTDRWPSDEAWNEVFRVNDDEASTPGRYISAAFRGPVARRLDAWLASATLEEILHWVPPSASQRPPASRPQSEIERWSWIVERFTKTYLDRWSLASLKHEYLHSTGEGDPVIPPEVLAERIVPLNAVAGHIAALAVRRDSEVDQAVLAALTEQAVELLGDGQRRAAAALFDGARTLSPGDVTATNNYAFCIMVDRPGEARELLGQALDQGISPRSVTLCNMALAEHLLGDDSSAMTYCQQVLEASPDGVRPAYLWSRTPDGDWLVVKEAPQDWARNFTGLFGITATLEPTEEDRLADSAGEGLSQILHQEE